MSSFYSLLFRTSIFFIHHLHLFPLLLTYILDFYLAHYFQDQYDTYQSYVQKASEKHLNVSSLISTLWLNSSNSKEWVWLLYQTNARTVHNLNHASTQPSLHSSYHHLQFCTLHTFEKTLSLKLVFNLSAISFIFMPSKLFLNYVGISYVLLPEKHNINILFNIKISFFKKLGCQYITKSLKRML